VYLTVTGAAVRSATSSRYPLTPFREAYTELERRHTHGKIVLRS
jgi:hypothetical protein